MKKVIYSFLVILLLSACATTKVQVRSSEEAVGNRSMPNGEITHTFYAIGGATDETSEALAQFKKVINQGKNKNSTALFLGDNVYSEALSSEKTFGEKNITSLNAQIDAVSAYDGNIIFVPGDSDWKNGLKGLKLQEKYIENALDKKNVFLPENGCPLRKVKLNDQVDILILDSQWVLANWNKYPGINRNCEIKNKEEFYVEVEAAIGKSQGKTVLMVLHHPIKSYGEYGGDFSFKSANIPLPIVGTIKNSIRKASGVNPNDLNNARYKAMRDRLLNLARQAKNVIFLSGHEKSLEYIEKKNVPIIVSGSGGKTKPVKLGRRSLFKYGGQGFTKLSVFKNGAIWVSFYGAENDFAAPLYEKEVQAPDVPKSNPNYGEFQKPAIVQKSIYTDDEVKRTAFFKALWGKHYRKDYATKIKVQTGLLDTLHGGLTPIRKGGGHQSNSLRLETKDGRQFVMRSAKKSALRFIQYFIFKEQYLSDDLEENYVVNVLQDYWTTANPYGLLTVGDLADEIGLPHANPQIYFIPRQTALGVYNEDYGDNLYFIEERLTDGHGEVKSLGNHNKIVSTHEVFGALREHKDKVNINEALYIRTRLFDNLIGDWDRHSDQWRWAEEEEEDGTITYEAIARDRDQVFSDFDGLVLKLLTMGNSMLRFMQRYDASYNHVKWFNDAGDDVDMAVLRNHTKEDWLREARYIKDNISEADIDKAFENFPEEIDQEKIAKVKEAFLGRLENIEENAIDVYEFLKSCVLITGTDKDDWFVITRKPGGITNVTAYRVKDGQKKKKFLDVDYNKEVTKEMWIYGLDNEDIFEVNGEGDHLIKIKIIGGEKNDIYRINNRKRIRIYDHKSSPNTFETRTPKRLSDNYDLNTYNFKKNKKSFTQGTPLLAYTNDNDFLLGASFTYTRNGLYGNPFSQQHNLTAQFVTGTTGFDLSYSGEFANIFNKVNLGIEARYTSPNFTQNFFGFGNETPNFDDDLGFDFNRARIQILSFAPSFIWRGYHGSIFKITPSYENVEVEQTADRFIISDDAGVNPEVFSGQQFLGLEVNYAYNNADNGAAPRLGFGMNLRAGYKTNIEEGSQDFFYLTPELNYTTKIDKRGILVFATKAKAQINFRDENLEFFQAASIGDQNGLRGYRQERFTGNDSFTESSDLRVTIGRIRNSLIPITYGVYGGFDIGRVWLDGEDSSEWHTSEGGGAFFTLASVTTANFALFSSGDGARFTFRLAFAF